MSLADTAHALIRASEANDAAWRLLDVEGAPSPERIAQALDELNVARGALRELAMHHVMAEVRSRKSS